MKTQIILACTITLSLFVPTTNADNTVYLGAAIGPSYVSHNNIDEAIASKFIIGFNPDKHIVIEASFYSTGEADFTLAQDVTIKTEGVNISLLYVLPATASVFSTAVGAGIYIFETTIVDPAFTGIGSSTTDTSGISLNTSTQYSLNETFALRADLNAFIGLEAFDENKTVISLLVGTVITF